MGQTLAVGWFWIKMCCVSTNWDHFKPDLDKFKQFLDLLMRESHGFVKLRELRDQWIELVDFRRVRFFKKGRLLEEKETVIVEDLQGLRHKLDEVEYLVWKMCDGSLCAADIQSQLIQVSGFSPD